MAKLEKRKNPQVPEKVERTPDDLRDLLARAGVALAEPAPVERGKLLEMIVRVAARVISSRAGSLFLVDPDTEELVFEVAIGPKAHEIKHLRVPLGHGIAGLVAASGQPMAIADASDDPRHAADVARAAGYAPKSILCVPLVLGDEVIGALELLDKEGDETFTAGDMELLGLFAAQAAVTIAQSRAHENMRALLGFGTPSSPASTIGPGSESAQQEILAMAAIIAEIARYGPSALEACHSILTSFASYLRTSAETIVHGGP
jgi:signal transduction protein with GAF and PtsI domain